MKYLKMFESDHYKEPIDVESDVIDFRKKFSKKLDDEKKKDEVRFNRLNELLNELADDNPTMRDDWNIYEVYNLDDDGRREGPEIAYVKAINRTHARIKASIITNNFFVFLWCSASLVEERTYLMRIRELEDQLQKIKNLK